MSQAEGGAAASVLLPSYSCSTPTSLSALVSTPPPLLMLQCTRYRRTRLPAASCRRAASRRQAQVRAQGGAVRCERRAGSRCHGGASKGLFASSWRGGAMWSRATQRDRRLLLARIQELLQSRGRVPQCAGGRALRRRWKQLQLNSLSWRAVRGRHLRLWRPVAQLTSSRLPNMPPKPLACAILAGYPLGRTTRRSVSRS